MLVCAFGYMRWPTGPASGAGCSGVLPAAAVSKTTFRVGTFNMHSGFGDDDVYNISRTIESVRDTDFCALNEVRGRLFGSPANQAEELGLATQHAWLYAPTERRFWHDDFGNGVLTRLPVENWVRVPLPTDPSHGGLRNVVVLRIRFGSETARVVVTHVDRAKDQANQLRMIARLFDSLQEPSVLLGDLNADSDNAEVRALLALPGVHDCISETTQLPRGRIDWILARGFNAVAGGDIQKGASDHPMYWVDLEVKH